MKYVLLILVWLTLCYSSLSANEVTLHTQKDLQISISNSVNFSKKKKAPIYAKIKLHSTKARVFLSENIAPDLPFKLKKTVLLLTQKVAEWNNLNNFSYHYIFSYLYPKHVFW